jgi:hypothetical protein
MISLPIQDQFDGSNKVQELRDAIGKTFSDNYSSTGNSKLLEVSKDGTYCVIQECKSEYSDKAPKSRKFRRPSWLIWNGMFY